MGVHEYMFLNDSAGEKEFAQGITSLEKNGWQVLSIMYSDGGDNYGWNCCLRRPLDGHQKSG